MGEEEFALPAAEALLPLPTLTVRAAAVQVTCDEPSPLLVDSVFCGWGIRRLGPLGSLQARKHVQTNKS